MVIVLILLGFVLSVGITSLIIPKIILISFKKKLFDTIDERILTVCALWRFFWAFTLWQIPLSPSSSVNGQSGSCWSCGAAFC